LMRMDDKAALPLIAIFVIVGIIVLFAGWILIALTMKSMITLLLVGVGVYLLVKPQGLQGNARVYVPIALIILGVAFYAGVFGAFG